MIYLKNTTEPQQVMIGIVTGSHIYIPNGGSGSSEGYDEGYAAGIAEQKGKLTSIQITENGEYVRDDGYNRVEVDITIPKLEDEINVKFNAGDKGTIIPSTGYDAIKKVNYIVPVNPAMVDFSVIGYNEPPLNMLNDIAYSKIQYDKWNQGEISNFKGHTELVYAPLVNTTLINSFYLFFYECDKLLSIPQIDTSNANDFYGMFQHCSSLKAVPLLNTSNATRMTYMFQGCSKLTEVPLFDTSKVGDMSAMFQGCSKLTEVPAFNTSNVGDMSYMFQSCSSLTTFNSNWDTSNVTNMYRMFYGCSNLTTFNVNWDTSKVKDMENMLYDCTKLTKISQLNCMSIEENKYPIFSYSNFTNLTDIGGFINMKSSWSSNFGLAKCQNLTYQSCLNILHGLYDFTGKGETPTSTQGKLKVHAKFLTTVGDDISIATDKGWSIIS